MYASVILLGGLGPMEIGGIVAVVALILVVKLMSGGSTAEEALENAEARLQMAREANAEQEASAEHAVRIRMAKAGDISAMTWGALKGNEEMVRAALDAGNPVNKADPEGWTMLHSAARGNQPDMIRLLIAAGASVSLTTDGGSTPIDCTTDPITGKPKDGFEESHELLRAHSAG